MKGVERRRVSGSSLWVGGGGGPVVCVCVCVCVCVRSGRTKREQVAEVRASCPALMMWAPGSVETFIQHPSDSHRTLSTILLSLSLFFYLSLFASLSFPFLWLLSLFSFTYFLTCAFIIFVWSFFRRHSPRLLATVLYFFSRRSGKAANKNGNFCGTDKIDDVLDTRQSLRLICVRLGRLRLYSLSWNRPSSIEMSTWNVPLAIVFSQSFYKRINPFLPLCPRVFRSLLVSSFFRSCEIR